MKSPWEMTLGEVAHLLDNSFTFMIGLIIDAIIRKQKEIATYKVQETKKLVSTKPAKEKEKKIYLTAKEMMEL